MSYTETHPGSTVFECAGCLAKLGGDDIRPEAAEMFAQAHKDHGPVPASPKTSGEGEPAGSAASVSGAPRLPAGTGPC